MVKFIYGKSWWQSWWYDVKLHPHILPEVKWLVSKGMCRKMRGGLFASKYIIFGVVVDL